MRRAVGVMVAIVVGFLVVGSCVGGEDDPVAFCGRLDDLLGDITAGTTEADEVIDRLDPDEIGDPPRFTDERREMRLLAREGDWREFSSVANRTLEQCSTL